MSPAALASWWRGLTSDERAATVLLWAVVLACSAFGTEQWLVNLLGGAAGAMVALGLVRRTGEEDG